MALPGAYGQEINTALAGAGGQAGDYWQGLQAQLGGAQAAGAGYRQDVGQALDAGQGLESVYRGQYTPYEQMMTLGGSRQSQQERQNQEAQQQFQYAQNDPWAGLQRTLGASAAWRHDEPERGGAVRQRADAAAGRRQRARGRWRDWPALAGGVMLAPYTGTRHAPGAHGGRARPALRRRTGLWHLRLQVGSVMMQGLPSWLYPQLAQAGGPIPPPPGAWAPRDAGPALPAAWTARPAPATARRP
jgi:hypothetical protein